MPFCSPKSVFTPNVCTQPEYPLFLVSTFLKLRRGREDTDWFLPLSLFPECRFLSSGPPDPTRIGNSLSSYLTHCGLLKCSRLDCSEMTSGHTEPVGTAEGQCSRLHDHMISQPLNSSQRQGSRINKNQ